MNLVRNLAISTDATPSAAATSYSPPFELQDGNACSVSCTVLALSGADIDAGSPTSISGALETSSDLENWSSHADLFETTEIGVQDSSVTDVVRRYLRLRFTLINGDGTNEVPGITLLSVNINTASLP